MQAPSVVLTSGPGGVAAGRGPLAVAAALLAAALAVLLFSAQGPPTIAPEPAADSARSYAKLPLSFVPNRGQLAGEARYHAQGGGFSFSFTEQAATLSFVKGERGQTLALSFVGANPAPRIEPLERAPGEVNYLTDNVHRTHIPTYGVIVYRDLWPGIDMLFKGRDGKLIYEFMVAPGADPSKIRLAWRGASGLSVNDAGRLLIETPLGSLTDDRPRTYQKINGRRVPVQSAFALERGSTHYGFSLGTYDRTRPLVIDPSLQYATFIGGGHWDFGYDIAIDGDGSAYVTGRAESTNFPTTPGAFDTTASWDDVRWRGDAFVTKLSADGASLEYSTYLGGSFFDTAVAIAVDGQERAFVGGYTDSPDFPTTPGAYDRSRAASENGFDDAFVTKLNADGSALVYSTYLGAGGDEYVFAIALDNSGNAYVTGQTNAPNFPTTVGAFDRTLSVGDWDQYDAFVTKVTADGSALSYSTYLGGTDSGGYCCEHGSGIAVDGSGSAHVSGVTGASDFPTTLGSFDTSFNSPGSQDAFVTKLNATGSAPLYSSFLGGGGNDENSGIALDGLGRVYTTGSTGSADFPTTAGAYDTSANGQYDTYVTRLNADGTSLSYSTYLGGSQMDDAGDIAVDGAGGAYVAGNTVSANFPTTPLAADTVFNTSGEEDAYVSRLSPDGSALAYSTFLGGSGDEFGNGLAIDGSGNAHATGTTYSPDFPTTIGAYDTTWNSAQTFQPDVYVAKLATSGPELETGRLIVRKDARPGGGQDFSFTAGGGLSPTTFALDDDPADATLSDTRVFDSIPAGSYSISEDPTPDWELASATCDDGSPPSNIDISPGEVVTCTFVNDLIGGYAYPIAAASASVTLVPASAACTSADGTHGAPLALPSCNPPTQSSRYLTFHAPDRPSPQRGAAGGRARIRLEVACRNGASSPCGADQQDVEITGSVTDVRCLGISGGCAGPGAPYTGKLFLRVPLRITDRQNGPSGNTGGTMIDSFALTAGIVCSAGGDCNVDTSVEAVYPADPVKEGRRAVWELSQVEVLDGGQDGDLADPVDCPPSCFPNDDEAVFLRQGLFVP